MILSTVLGKKMKYVNKIVKVQKNTKGYVVRQYSRK